MALMTWEIREKLLTDDAEFKRLAEEHSSYEAQLDQLTKSPYVSVEKNLLEANLKKMKLRVKDQMEKRAVLLSKPC